MNLLKQTFLAKRPDFALVATKNFKSDRSQRARQQLGLFDTFFSMAKHVLEQKKSHVLGVGFFVNMWVNAS